MQLPPPPPAPPAGRRSSTVYRVIALRVRLELKPPQTVEEVREVLLELAELLLEELDAS